MKRFIPTILLAVLLGASGAEARLWPWPEDFEEVPGRRLGERFITEEEGDSLAKQELCLDCHDGSALDHRELWDPNLHGHREGVTPSEPLPEGIPLVDGRLYCGSCHLPHGGLPGSKKEVRKPFLRYENTNDVFCVVCHQERATPGPQQASRNHSFLKKARQDTATADPESWSEIRRLGGRVGKDGAVRCQSCHKPHGAPSRSALIALVDRSQLCSICHHDIRDDSVQPNHPLHGENSWKEPDRPATVECLTCHRVHEAPVPGLLLAESGETMCLRCHSDSRLSDDDLHRNRKIGEAAGSSAAGLCGACHQTHRAKGGFLAGTVGGPAGSDAATGLCAACHAAEGSSQAEKQIGPFYHFLGKWPEPSAGSGATRPAGGALPLLTPKGEVQGDSGRLLGCRTCHFMHDRPASVQPDPAGKNLRQTTQGGALCLACHGDRRSILETDHNPLRLPGPDMRKRFPLKGGNPCSACHAAHQGRTFRLSPDPVFPSADTDPESAACLGCHGGRPGKAETGVGKFGHPLGPWPTSAGKTPPELALPEGLPLLSASPNAPAATGKEAARTSGQLTCGTCHRLHAAGEAAGIDAKYLRPPIRPEAACTLCHPAQRVLGKTKHSIRDPLLSGIIEKKFGKATERHECTPCHDVHNARGPGLWFTPLPKARSTFEQDERSRRCLVCHLEDGLKKIEERNGHPIGKAMSTEYMPAPEQRLKLGRIGTDEAGVKDVVVCATCHLNHGIENPDGSVSLFAGAGLPEGELCMACHGRNARIVGSPHDFRTRREGELRPDDGRSLRFGVCGGCHANHGARIDQGLIAFGVDRPQAQGNPEDMLCLHCHRDPRITKDPMVRFYVHPSGPEVQERFRDRLPDLTPLLPRKLGEPGRTTLEGYEAIFRIRCVTCHDNHRWTALPPGEAEAFEGSELTGFLRGSDVARTLCSNCHGIDALYRYRFFHQDRAFRLKIPNR
ncbi:MAG: cytochrome c3 family protein [bacterium]